MILSDEFGLNEIISNDYVQSDFVCDDFRCSDYDMKSIEIHVGHKLELDEFKSDVYNVMVGICANNYL